MSLAVSPADREAGLDPGEPGRGELGRGELGRGELGRGELGRGEAAERRRLELDLRQAVAQERLVLHYQPRCTLSTGRVFGAEALLRWPHRKRGLIAPSTFLPYAERTGLITRIGAWALRHACGEARDWPPGVRLSVNIAARQMADGTLLGQIADALALSGFPAERLEIEMSEAALLEGGEEALFALAALRDNGIGVLLDDFGAGTTSLALLRRVPLSGVKLDRSLVRGLPEMREDALIVRALIEVAHALGLSVAAEGVETAAQRDFLAGIGCDEAQGHLFGPAMAPAALAGRFGPAAR